MKKNRSKKLFAIGVVFAVSLLLRQPVAARMWNVKGQWVNTWVSMPQLTETHNLPPEPFTQPDLVLADSTLRQTIRSSIGGKLIRLRFSNAFGGSALAITSVHIALPEGGAAGVSAIRPETDQAVTFNGKASVVVPVGAQVVSDPLQFELPPKSNLAVSIYMAEGQASNNITSHPGSRTTSYMVFGDHVSDADLGGGTSANHWYFLSGVEVWTQRTEAALVVLGDSLTDGRGSTTNMNNRWPDQLFDRLQADRITAGIAVLNQAAGGNRVLNDGLGPNALARLDRDVLAQSGVKWLILFEGVNDIGTAEATQAAQEKVAQDLIDAYNQIITRANAKGIRVYGATLIPFGGSFYDEGTGYRDAARQKVNQWIRNSGKFDAVIDFDKITRDPQNPATLKEGIDDGDFLHLNPDGYKLLADAVSERLLLH